MHIRRASRVLLPIIFARPIVSSLVEASATYASPSKETESGPPTCPARAINYITQILPQLCLTSAWTSPTASSGEAPDIRSSDGSPSNPQASFSPDAAAYNATGRHAAAPDSNPDSEEVPVEPASTPFMSFEDWKEMMLRQTGQDPRDLRQRQATPQGPNDRTPPDSVHAGLGEEDEISLNFDGYPGDVEEHKQASDDSVANSNLDGAEGTVTFEDGRPSIHRSKDAGKTCKERFSYSSFDAGATVLKTSPGAKNAKAILVENKDSYMLLECSAKNKFVIVELSDDILIDTIVLANFEFFSSMIRHFRVSVSDRFPIKIERWKELGMFEARNSRDIQPFLVENPQIWAKYVRVEFLTHYGNEYYCPVSLIRVHGSRMLDSWKDSEAGGRDDEGHIEDHPEHETMEISGEGAHVLGEEMDSKHPKVSHPLSMSLPQCTVDPYLDQPRFSSSTCEAYPRGTEEAIAGHPQGTITDSSDSARNESYVTRNGEQSHHHDGRHAQTQLSQSEDLATPTATASLDNTSSTTSTVANANGNTHTNSSIETPTVSSRSSTTISTPSSSKVSSQVGSVGKNRTSATTSASAASPTIQESFFKTITKRLQQVETNLTLSLKYVEDHARHVQEMLQKNENKQTSKVAVFLENLNQTVLAELRNVREQYDEIWQSTVIALESQREQSGREIIALSTRLNLLADEVVFQKRMAIVQAVLLLSCLLLVIFSRGVSMPSLIPLVEQPGENIFGAPKASTPQPHVLYQSGIPIASDMETDFDGQGEMDYAPVAHISQVASETSHLPSSTECSGQSKATKRHHQRLSPSLTSSNLDPLMESNDDILAYDPSSNPFRTPLSQQQTTVRKPLPALPENPSSP